MTITMIFKEEMMMPRVILGVAVPKLLIVMVRPLALLPPSYFLFSLCLVRMARRMILVKIMAKL